MRNKSRDSPESTKKRPKTQTKPGLNYSVQTSKPNISPRSNSLFARRVESSLATVLAKYGEKVSHEEYLAVLRELAFISAGGKNGTEAGLAEEMWMSLASGAESVEKQILKERIMTIMGCGRVDPQMSRRYGVFRANRLNSSAAAGQRKTSSEQKMQKSSKSSSAQEELSFSPKISVVSSRYAESARKRQVRTVAELNATPTSKSKQHDTPVKTTLRSFLSLCSSSYLPSESKPA